jgi:hypothetical protein
VRVTTILVTACGAPGAARLLRALRENGERPVRLVGVDMSERAIGRHLCDAFHLVPAGADPSFPDALLSLVEEEHVDVVLPESSHDLRHLAPRRGEFPVPVLICGPGALAMRLEEAVELLPDDGLDLLVMEFLTEPERTVDGIADGSRIVLQATRTRESVRCGLGMYFVTLDAPELVAASERIVEEFELEWFFSIQFMGEKVIEINPRISTMMIQEDFNLPWLAVKRALGEASDDELRALQGRVRPGHTVLRFFDQVEFDP